MKRAGVGGRTRAGPDAQRVVASPRTVGTLIALVAFVVPAVAAAQTGEGPARVWLALGLAGGAARIPLGWMPEGRRTSGSERREGPAGLAGCRGLARLGPLTAQVGEVSLPWPLRFGSSTPVTVMKTTA